MPTVSTFYRTTINRSSFLLFLGRNDPLTKCLSVVGAAHELDILAEAVVRGPGTVPHEIRLERNRNDRRVFTDNNQLKSRRCVYGVTRNK